MLRMNLRLLFVVCVACISFACADSGTVPEPEPIPTPMPVPEETEPYLDVSPAMLSFDSAGNALNGKGFIVKTNCAWRLDIPEEADWLEVSDVAGEGADTVSFRLYIDRTYHAAELVFTAQSTDGSSALTQSVTVRQGTEPAESDPSDPTDPNTPDDNPPSPSNPENPSDDPSGSGDSKNDPDQKPNTDPDAPPAIPAVPSIVAVDPTFLWWNADDRGQTKQVVVYVANFDSYTLDVSIKGANADRFEVQNPVRDGLIVQVSNVGVNESDVDYTASLVISVKGGNSLSVLLTQVKRIAGSGDQEDDDKSNGGDEVGSGGDDSGGTLNNGDNSGSDDGTQSGNDHSDEGSGTPGNDVDSGGSAGTVPDNGNGAGGGSGSGSGGNTMPPAGDDSDVPARGGGSDDFTHLKPESLFKDRVGPTPAGWRGEYCAVYSGGGTNSDPTYPSLLGPRARAKGLAMNGKTTGIGRIISPEIEGGCGTLSFNYGITDAGDRQIDFTVEIQQNGVAVETFQVKRTAEKFEKYTFTTDVQVSGRFRIVFTNNCPSKQAKDKDRYTIFHIEWTGWK